MFRPRKTDENNDTLSVLQYTQNRTMHNEIDGWHFKCNIPTHQHIPYRNLYIYIFRYYRESRIYKIRRVNERENGSTIARLMNKNKNISNNNKNQLNIDVWVFVLMVDMYAK